LAKSNENTYQNGRALMQMYRVVPITKMCNSSIPIVVLGIWITFGVHSSVFVREVVQTHSSFHQLISVQCVCR